MSQTSKNWCFTINNYSELDISALTGAISKYVIMGKEVGASGTPHLQGFIVLENVQRMSAMKKVHPTAHWEIAKGTAAQNRVYCSKDGDFIEQGEMPMSAKEKGLKESERWDKALECAKSGNFKDIPSDIYIRYVKNVHFIHSKSQIVPESLEGDLINVWLYGEAGCGKSTRAFRENPGAYIKGVNKWWDGYENQETVIIDDMDPYHKVLALEFKMWGQHQPFAAEQKGSCITIRPKKIVVTSNYSIDEIWEDQTTRDAMHRRYKEVCMSKNYESNFHPCFNKENKN